MTFNNSQRCKYRTVFVVYQLLDVQFYIATDVGANIQIGTSNGDDTQIWIYEQDGTMKDQDLCIDVGSTTTSAQPPWNTYPYCDHALDIETRTKDLLNGLELFDKVYNLIL